MSSNSGGEIVAYLRNMFSGHGNNCVLLTNTRREMK